MSHGQDEHGGYEPTKLVESVVRRDNREFNRPWRGKAFSQSSAIRIDKLIAAQPGFQQHRYAIDCWFAGNMPRSETELGDGDLSSRALDKTWQRHEWNDDLPYRAVNPRVMKTPAIGIVKPSTVRIALPRIEVNRNRLFTAYTDSVALRFVSR